MIGERASDLLGMSKPVFSARQKWRRIIERQQAAGLGVSAFCRENGIATSCFFAWKRKLGRAGADGGLIDGGLIEARVVDAAAASLSGGRIEVCLRGGRRVRVGRGFDRDVLVEVVAMLEGLPSRLEGMSARSEGLS